MNLTRRPVTQNVPDHFGHIHLMGVGVSLQSKVRLHADLGSQIDERKAHSAFAVALRSSAPRSLLIVDRRGSGMLPAMNLVTHAYDRPASRAIAAHCPRCACMESRSEVIVSMGRA